MRYWVGAAIVLAMALVQTASVEQFRVIGVIPNLMVVLLVTWVVVRGLDDALPMIFVAGVALGLLGLQTPGLVLLALMPIAVFGLLREMSVVHNNLFLAMTLVGASSIAYEGVILLSLLLTGGGRDIIAALTYSVVPAAIVNIAITPFIYAPMRLARPGNMGHRLSF